MLETILGELVYGVVSGEGPEWYEQRKFMLKTLTDLGMGKKDVMEDIISEEAEQLVDLLKPRAGTKIKSKVRHGMCTRSFPVKTFHFNHVRMLLYFFV